jgi:hypothetical protein
MTRERDPLGKRALFSDGPVERATEQRKPAPFDVTVHCSSCDARTTLSAPAFLLQHFPVWAWIPWRKHSRLMRCPACSRLSWVAVSLGG